MRDNPWLCSRLDDRIFIGKGSDTPLRTTINTLLPWASDVLEQSGVPEASLNAEFLLAHVLGLDRLRLKLVDQRELAPDELLLLSTLIERRTRREPLQYIIGTAEFMGLKFDVNPDVLIPRPETEILVEKALEVLRSSPVTHPEVLDVGSGSGNIALSVKYHFPSAVVTAMDVSVRALRTAIRNSRLNAIDGVTFLEADMLSDFLPGRRFNLILSNPPYVSKDEFDSLDPEVRLYEPMIATTDGVDGFRFIRRLLETASGHLLPGGIILLEVGYGQSEDAAGYAKECGLRCIRVHEDLSGIPRVLSATLPAEKGVG